MTDNLNPNYYKFPNGAETIDISQYLSGCGSQAVQYVVRSTRIDKDLKGEPLEDLRKAIWFIEREIERLTVELEDEADVEAAREAREEPRITLDEAGDILSDGLDVDEVVEAVLSGFQELHRTGRMARASTGSYL